MSMRGSSMTLPASLQLWPPTVTAAAWKALEDRAVLAAARRSVPSEVSVRVSSDVTWCYNSVYDTSKTWSSAGTLYCSFGSVHDCVWEGDRECVCVCVFICQLPGTNGPIDGRQQQQVDRLEKVRDDALGWQEVSQLPCQCLFLTCCRRTCCLLLLWVACCLLLMWVVIW